MNKNGWMIIILYTLVQFSGAVGVPLLLKLGMTEETNAVAWWSVISFSFALVITLFLSKGIPSHPKLKRSLSKNEYLRWIIIGVVLAYLSQVLSSVIEQSLFHVSPESENTNDILAISRIQPAFMVVAILCAPVLEEIIFRKIVFGALYKRLSYVPAALLSSLVFAALHMDFTHLLVYTAMGFVFSYVYIKSGQIIVPITAHVIMNGTVFLLAFQ